MNKELKNNECRSICARCGGECCLRMPGAYFPEQLGLKEGQDENNAKILEAALFSNYGKCQLVDGIGEPSSYNICGEYEPLPAEELAEYDWCRNLVIIPAEGLGCCHWSCTEGCKLSWEERPTMCKALSPSEPDAEGRRYCQSEISLRELSRVWEPYQGILKVCKDLRGLRKLHRKVWNDCYGPKSKITKEVILFFLKRKEEDVWSFCFKKSEEKRQEEEKRIKEENNPLFAALKNAGF